MDIDPENPVVKLCGRGMEAEGDGRPDEAAALFVEAYELATDEYDRSIAAHYVARHQATAPDTLAWNLRALVHAEGVGDGRAEAFMPSLLLCVGKAYEDVGTVDLARAHYERASVAADVLGDDGYGQMIRGGIANGLERTAAPA